MNFIYTLYGKLIIQDGKCFSTTVDISIFTAAVLFKHYLSVFYINIRIYRSLNLIIVLFPGHCFGHSKITDFCSVFIHQQYITRGQISVDILLLLQVGHSWGDLPHDLHDVWLLHISGNQRNFITSSFRYWRIINIYGGNPNSWNYIHNELWSLIFIDLLKRYAWIYIQTNFGKTGSLQKLLSRV